jgi:hypothetical protein
LPSYYVPPEQVERFEGLREAQRTRRRLQSSTTWERQLLDAQQLLPGVMDTNWIDPVGGAYAGVWLAAFEPVPVVGRPDTVSDIGWTVIVQERADRSSER